MFLKLQNNEEKKSLLGIAYHAAVANDLFDSFEKEMIKQFSQEKDLSEEKYPLREEALEELLEKHSKSSDQVKRAAHLEALAVCLSNNQYDQHEQTLKLAPSVKRYDHELAKLKRGW